MSHFVGNRWPAALLLAVVMPSLRVDRNRVRSRVVSHVAALIGFTLLIPAFADDLTPLTLGDAVRLAELHAPALDARQAALQSAQYAIGPAGQLPDPELEFGIDSLPVDTDERFSLTRDNFTERKIGLMQTFPRKEKRELRTQRAEASAAREQALLTTQQLSVGESVARAWIARHTAERRLMLLESLRPRVAAEVAAAIAGLTAGRGSAADAITAKTGQAMVEDRISEARREVEDARADFARWLPDAQNRALGEAPDWADLGVDPNKLLSHIGHHRELLAYDAAEREANADVALARAEKHPDWSVELSYAQRGPQYSNFLSVMVRVPLPIFAKHRQDLTIASKAAAVAQIEAEREDALRMHTAELRKTLNMWRNSTERVRRYEKELLPLAEDRADAALAAYRGGGGNLQASLSALDNAIEQRIAYTDVLNTLGQSWAALHFAFPEEH